MSTFSYEIEPAGMFMMTPCINSGLSLPTENLRFSLPVYLSSVNILVCSIDSKSTADVLEIITKLKI